jgi:hypothetical protein
VSAPPAAASTSASRPLNTGDGHNALSIRNNPGRSFSQRRRLPLGQHAIDRLDADAEPRRDVLALHAFASEPDDVGRFGVGGRRATLVLAFPLRSLDALALALKA